jgi:hypothetical protein
MEPLDDKELNQLLRTWEAPGAPKSLERRLFRGRSPWWAWLFTGTIRVPVPVGVAALIAILLLFHYWKTPSPTPAAPAARSVSLADFQPVEHLEPVVVGDQK